MLLLLQKGPTVKRFIVFSLLLLLPSVCFSLSFDMQDAPLLDLVDWVSDATGKNIIVSPGVDQRLSLKVKDITPAQIWPFFVACLKSQGLTVTEKDLFYLVAPSTAEAIAIPSTVQPLPAVWSVGAGDEVTVPADPPIGNVYALQNVLYSSVADALKVISPSSVFVSIPGSQNFYMSGLDLEHEKIAFVLPSLDTALPRVLVEAVVMEIASNKMQEVGVSVAAILENAKIISTFLSPRLPGSLTSYSRSDFTAVVSALQGLDDVKLLSSPSILVSHGSTGSVVVGQNVPFVTGSYTDAGENNINPFQTIERQDIGLKLTVNPFVISSDLIDLTITQEVSNISSDTSASDLVTNKRSIKTSLSLAVGTWISLGGLVSETTDKSVFGVPGLMNIPFLGGLFRVNKSSIKKQDLSVLIRVTIV